MPPIAAAIGSAAERRLARLPDRELALDLEPHDQEEDREQPVVHPVQKRHPRHAVAEAEPERRVARTRRTPARRPSSTIRMATAVAQQQQDAGRRRPAREVERRRAHAMAERAEHRVRKRALVPGPVVAAAVDEEGRREAHAARLRARYVGVDPLARGGAPPVRFCGLGSARPSSSATAPRSSSVSVGGARHQRDVRVPEPIRRRRRLGQLGRAAGDVAPGQRPVAEHVAQPVAELGRARCRCARWRPGNAGRHSCRTRPA